MTDPSRVFRRKGEILEEELNAEQKGASPEMLAVYRERYLDLCAVYDEAYGGDNGRGAEEKFLLYSAEHDIARRCREITRHSSCMTAIHAAEQPLPAKA